MLARERFHAVANFQPFDRLPMIEWASWWDTTLARWYQEGLPAELTDRYDLYRHFGLDVYQQDWIAPHVPAAPTHGAPVITGMDDYLALRPTLFPEHPVKTAMWQRWAQQQAEGDTVLWFSLDGFFWFPRRLFGIEPHLYAFYDEPELMHLINDDLTEWNLRVIEEICSICTPDFMSFGEDMSYNHGPMLSHELFNEFLRPYYQRIVPVLRERGIVPVMDSDGDVTELAPWLEEVGIRGILPLERQAGVDIACLRADHPEMLFIGHFDKMTMSSGKEAMRAEFERLLPTAQRGGFLISVDHQTLPGVSYAQYLDYLELFREYAEKAGKANIITI